MNQEELFRREQELLKREQELKESYKKNINLQYIMEWWKNKSIPACEDKGGTFNRDLYMRYLEIVNNYPKI